MNSCLGGHGDGQRLWPQSITKSSGIFCLLSQALVWTQSLDRPPLWPPVNHNYHQCSHTCTLDQLSIPCTHLHSASTNNFAVMPELTPSLPSRSSVMTLWALCVWVWAERYLKSCQVITLTTQFLPYRYRYRKRKKKNIDRTLKSCQDLLDGFQEYLILIGPWWHSDILNHDDAFLCLKNDILYTTHFYYVCTLPFSIRVWQIFLCKEICDWWVHYILSNTPHYFFFYVK